MICLIKAIGLQRIKNLCRRQIEGMTEGIYTEMVDLFGEWSVTFAALRIRTKEREVRQEKWREITLKKKGNNTIFCYIAQYFIYISSIFLLVKQLVFTTILY